MLIKNNGRDAEMINGSGNSDRGELKIIVNDKVKGIKKLSVN
jgi:hypothetical protein